MCPTVSIAPDDEHLKGALQEAMAEIDHAASKVNPVRLWWAERSLQDFVNTINFAPASRADIEGSLGELRSLHQSVKSLGETSQSLGPVNRVLCAPLLNAIRRHAEEILDFAEGLDLRLDPEARSLDQAGYFGESTIDFESLLR